MFLRFTLGAVLIQLLTIQTFCQKQITDIVPENSIINLYDAFGHDIPGLTKDFGFSCLVNYNGKIILFDSGTNADIFKKNTEHLGIDLSQIDFVVVSHAHFDHINGLDHLLKVNPDVKIYFPHDVFWGANMSFNLSGTEPGVIDSLDKNMQYFDGEFTNYHFNQSGRFWKANIEFVNESTTIMPGIRLIATSSPYMGYFNKYPRLQECDTCATENVRFNNLNELSLSLGGENGETVIVGCSHSTVEKIISQTIEETLNDISLVYGGYHLIPYDRDALDQLALRLKDELNVKTVAPAHCTGHLAFSILQRIFGDQYVYAGLGEVTRF